MKGDQENTKQGHPVSWFQYEYVAICLERYWYIELPEVATSTTTAAATTKYYYYSYILHSQLCVYNA
jgi:hypothetical protein